MQGNLMRKLKTALLITFTSSPIFTGRAMDAFSPESQQKNKYTIACTIKRILKGDEKLVTSLYWKDDSWLIIWSFNDSFSVYNTSPIKPSSIIPLLFTGKEPLMLPFAKIGTQEDQDEKKNE
jgi:hypothetical protein